MEKRMIRLQTREQLNIYLNPARQELMHVLSLAGEPQTAKALSDRLHISASSVQYHLKKLMALGLVEVDHQAVIRGITATYYRPTQVDVRVGLEADDGLREQREALTTSLVNQSLQGFLKTARACSDLPGDELTAYGDLLSGVAHLGPEERRALLEQVTRFLADHSTPSPSRSEHWSFLLLAYREREAEG